MTDKLSQTLLEQNSLLRDQNGLLEEQNTLLRKQNAILVTNTWATASGAIFGLAAIAVALVALIK